MNKTYSSLACIDYGTKCRVVDIKADISVKRRLIDLGIVSGTLITLVYAAPFGDPILIKVLDYYLSIRRSVASKIFVEL